MEEIRDRELNIVGERYRSFLEFYRVNQSRPFNALYEGAGDGAADGLFEVADGVTFSWQDTREALLYGSDLFRDRFEDAKVKAQNVLRDTYDWLDQARIQTDTHGQNVILERHMIGHPKSFARRLESPRKKRSVRILYDAMCPASTPLDERIDAGCAVLAALDALEQLGYEVALSFLLAKYSGSNVTGDATLVLDIPIKDFGDHALPARMEFPLASKSMLFHVGCWWARRFSRTPVNYGPGEGFSVSYDKGRIESMRAYAAKHRGVYLSEDIIEVQLESSTARVLEHIAGVLGDERELLAHLRTGTPLSASVEPEQGKLFAGWNPGTGAGDAEDVGGAGDAEGAPEGADESGRDNLDRSDGKRADAPQTSAAPGASEDSGRGSEADEAAGSAPDEADGRASDDESAGGMHGGEFAGSGDAGGAFELAEDMPDGVSHNGAAVEHEMPGGDAAEGDASREDDGGYDAPSEEPLGSRSHDRASDAGLPQDSSSSSARASSAQNDEVTHDGAAEAKSAASNNSSGSKSTEGDASEGADDPNAKDGGAADGGTHDEETASDDKGAGMPDKNQEGGMDFAQIAKAMDDDMVDADPALPQTAEEFVVMLRRRYLMFEDGEYLDMMIRDKMAKRKAAKAVRESTQLKPPPIADAPTIDNVQFGAPRNTPFSMTNIPHKK